MKTNFLRQLSFVLMLGLVLLGSESSFATSGMPRSIRMSSGPGSVVYAELGEIDLSQLSFRGCDTAFGATQGLFTYDASRTVTLSVGQTLYQLVNRPFLPPLSRGHLVSYPGPLACEQGEISLDEQPTMRLVFQALGAPMQQVILTIRFADDTVELSPNRIGETQRVFARGRVTAKY